MRYILDDNNYIKAISFGSRMECYGKECVEYTGSVPSGYSTLGEWASNAVIQAYYISEGELVYDAAKEDEIEAAAAEDAAYNKPATEGYVKEAISTVEEKIPTVPSFENYYTKTELDDIFSRYYSRPEANQIFCTFDQVWPVGSIFINTRDDLSPAQLVGGTWEQLPAGYALWTASSGAGGTIGAGLPNITGGLTGFCSWASAYTEGGALTAVKANGGPSSGTSRHWSDITFNASLSNSIYGKSSTVQPPAYKIYAWKRVA